MTSYLLLLLTVLQLPPQARAFPGAQGFGSETPGGRGGEVHIVTTLEDHGEPGSLRWAVEQTGPRTVVFEVAGVIELREPLRIGGRRQAPPTGDNPYSFLTIAGESAPGGGITLTGYPVEFNNDVHDVIVRHIRVRGPRVDEMAGSIGDGLAFMGAHHIIIDHVSLSWFADEGISIESTANRVNHDITVQHSFVSEGLLNGGHPSGGPHSRCAIASDGSFNISFHHNVFMSCNRRSPSLAGNSNLGATDFPITDVRYNLVYNAGEKGIQFARGAMTNIVGNLIRSGPQTTATHPMEAVDRQADGTQVFLDGNCTVTVAGNEELLECPANQTSLVAETNGQGLVTWLTTPFSTPEVLAVSQSPRDILANAGAHPADQADSTFRSQYELGGGNMGAGGLSLNEIPIPEPVSGVAEADTDRDGLPDAWEVATGLDPSNPEDSRQGSPYTHLERYLHERAAGDMKATGTEPSVTPRPTSSTLQVFPNPARNTLHVASQHPVRIFNMTGSLVLEGRSPLPVSTIPPGLYLAVDVITGKSASFVRMR